MTRNTRSKVKSYHFYIGWEYFIDHLPNTVYFNNAAIDFFAIWPSDRAVHKFHTPDFLYESPTISTAFVLLLHRMNTGEPDTKWNLFHALLYAAFLSIAFTSMNEIKSLLKRLCVRRFY